MQNLTAIGKIIATPQRRPFPVLTLAPCELVTSRGKRDLAEVVEAKDPEMRRACWVI